MTAPDGSVMVPDMIAPTTWANAAGPRMPINIQEANTNLAVNRRMRSP
jgi:hypothetical protein